MKLPKLVAFDLDGTIWTPDMYQLWGGGAPFKVSKNGKDLLDRSGQVVRLLGVSAQILDELQNHGAFEDTKVAWVSCTDEPDWAEQCLSMFQTEGGSSIGSVAHQSEIYKANKQTHFRNLKEKYPSIEFSDMLFFDNEQHNLVSVSKLGVKCVHAPRGMEVEAWEKGLALFSAR